MIALSIFGTPRGADAIVHPPIELSLPGTLNQAVDAPFKYYSAIEVFRFCRFRVGTKLTNLYALQTQCFDLRGPRDGQFIGVGIFTTAMEYIDPVLLVRGLRELLASAQRTVTVDGKFSKTITEARRHFQIPSEVEQILNISQAETPEPATLPPITTNPSRNFFVLGERPKIEIEDLIETFQKETYLSLDNVYASGDKRVFDDCQTDVTTTVHTNLVDFRQRHDRNMRAAFGMLTDKLKRSESTLNALNEELIKTKTQFLDTLEQRIAGEHEKFRNETLSLQREIMRLKNEHHESKTIADEQGAIYAKWSLTNLVLAAVAIAALSAGLGHVIQTASHSQWLVSCLAALPIVALLVALGVSVWNADRLAWWEWLLVAMVIAVLLAGVILVYGYPT